MNIAVLSGKGGTGKTLAAVNLAAIAKNAAYIDCDVEEPNGALFFKPENITEEAVNIKIPQIDTSLCTGCRACTDFCRFNALAYIQNEVLVFEEMCHSCGGCILACTNQAITEKDKTIGKVQYGISQNTAVSGGILNIGEASGVPIIKALLSMPNRLDTPVFIDCPPGSACIVMESIKDADYCIIVTEPTLFGLHNFEMVYELVKFFNKPFGVILNKHEDGIENPIEVFCKKNHINILGKIPFDTELAKLTSDALIPARVSDKYSSLFLELWQIIIKDTHYETTIDS